MDLELAEKIMNINKKTYDLIAEDFSDTRNRVWPEMERLIRQYVKEGDKVLDVGCGNGRLLDILPKVDYLGIDNSKGLIDEAKSKLGNSEIGKFGKVDFKVMDILKLHQIEERNFDVIFMFAVFNHMPSEELRLKVLNNIKKILKLNGLLIMTNWNLWQLGQKKSVWSRKIKKFGFRDLMTVWQSGDKQRKGELYYRAFTKWELNKLFKQARFELVENYYSCGDRKCHWWDGRNIVTVGRLIKLII
ncbi:MAG: class I SAM-dependent methyltransferase [Candidatus Kuenenbacteria bacterium]